MSGEFRKLAVKKFPKAEFRKDTLEQKYWKGFQFPTIVKEFSAINHVNFSPVAPYDCLVTCSGKIQIFAPYTHEVKRTSNRNKENVYGTRYRLDGKLMVAGGDSGLVQVLDVNSRSILRNLRGHTKATHVCSFGKEYTKVFSASDDKTVRYWDLPTEKELVSIKAHKDYIRSGCINPVSTDQFITGSYDHIVKIWDTRSSSVAAEMNHGAPVECVIMHQNGSICLSAGGNYVKVWDLLAGGKLYHHFSNHQKTITTICFDGEYKRLLSGGLDRHVKVYDIKDFSIIANLDYPSPVLAMDLSEDGNHLCVGMTDGAISLRHRQKPRDESKKGFTDISSGTGVGGRGKKRTRRCLPGTYQYRMRNQTSKPKKADFVVKDHHHRRLSKADRCLQKFRYHDALDVVLGKDGSNVPYVISVIIELSRRDALEIALSDRDADSLSEIMHFLSKNISNPMFSKILVPVANLILDMYADLIGENKKFDYMVSKLNNRLKMDLHTQDEMMKLLGAMEQIFSMSTPAPELSDDENDSGINEDMILGNDNDTLNDVMMALIPDNDVDFMVSNVNKTEPIVIS